MLHVIQAKAFLDKVAQSPALVSLELLKGNKMLNEQEKKIAEWILFGMKVAKANDLFNYKTAEEVWASFTAEQKLEMTVLFDAHCKWFKENT